MRSGINLFVALSTFAMTSVAQAYVCPEMATALNDARFAYNHLAGVANSDAVRNDLG